jgi:hypothetical protein
MTCWTLSAPVPLRKKRGRTGSERVLLDFRVATKVTSRGAAALDDHVAVLESAMHAGT